VLSIKTGVQGPPAGGHAYSRYGKCGRKALEERNSVKHKKGIPYPLDMVKKLEAQLDALVPTERFAQKIEKVVNGELRKHG
jgi:hypothetical protein